MIAAGHFHPPAVLDNDFLESLDIGVDKRWIEDRVGIRQRRTVLDLDYIRHTRNKDPRAADEAAQFTNAQTGCSAARLAIERAGIAPSDIGMVIAGGCSPQHTIPAEACKIAAEIGIDAPCADINSACSSFAAHAHFLASMRPEALPDYILVVSAENNTRTVNYNDRGTAVLWGDGTSAAIFSPRVRGRASVETTFLQSRPAGWNAVATPTGGHFQQDGPAVQGFAIRAASAGVARLAEAVRDDARSAFIGHQGNLLMLKSIASRAGVLEELHYYNVDRFGNCGAAGAPSVLSERWDSWSAGYLSLVVVGSGLTWGGVLFRCNEADGGAR